MDFNTRFSVSDALLSAFRSFASGRQVKMERMSRNDLAEITLRLKALLARQLWRSEGYYMVINNGDQAIGRAVEELGKMQ